MEFCECICIYGIKTDIYSFGVMMIEMMFTKILKRAGLTYLISAVREGVTEWPAGVEVDNHLLAIATKMISLIPEERGKLAEHLLAISQEEKVNFKTTTQVFKQNIKEELEILFVKSLADLRENAFKFRKISLSLSE